MTKRTKRTNDPPLDAMEVSGDDITRDDSISTSYLGGVNPDKELPEEIEGELPTKFQRVTLLETRQRRITFNNNEAAVSFSRRLVPPQHGLHPASGACEFP